MSDLDRLEALRAAATPGEWKTDRKDGDEVTHITSASGPVATVFARPNNDVRAMTEAEYITALHNADLIGRIRVLEGREAKLREWYGQRGYRDINDLAGNPQQQGRMSSMKVSELIATLQTMPADAQTITWSDDYDYVYIEGVNLRPSGLVEFVWGKSV